MPGEDDNDAAGWIERLQGKLPYVIGVLGLIAWLAMLWFMVRDVL